MAERTVGPTDVTKAGLTDGPRVGWWVAARAATTAAGWGHERAVRWVVGLAARWVC